MTKPLKITDVVLRDGHQSLLATRMRIDDMLPVAAELDDIGYWSLETWGGATFDACIRYLGEDPWERLRAFKQAMPKTPQQMLLRGQNILGYRHYADDVVYKFVERAAINGIDVFRVFDALNDMRNVQTAIKAVKENGKHAQGTLSYTLSPAHNLQLWLDKAKELEDMNADSICIKDMAGLLKPYVGYELVKSLKQCVNIPIFMQCHATTGLSTSTIVKCVEAGIDGVDTSISSMSMTYGHSPTESVVAIFEGTEHDTGLDLNKLEDISDHVRQVRKKYAQFEGSLKGIDSRILVAQVPGGMLTNMENQLREQNAEDKFDQVLQEIPRVRSDLGYIPLVTPTSQIVGSQAVINVLQGEAYKSISKETAALLKGEYGATPAPVNSELQQKVLEQNNMQLSDVITCRPADLLINEFAQLQQQLIEQATEQNISLQQGDLLVEDTLTYALFQQVGLFFLKNRSDSSAFEPLPTVAATLKSNSSVENTTPAIYTIEHEGNSYTVSVTKGGSIDGIAIGELTEPTSSANAINIVAPLAGSIITIPVKVGQAVAQGDVLLTLEAMKMETAISAPSDGTVLSIKVSAGDKVQPDSLLITLG